MLLSSEFICWFKRGYEAKDKMLNVFNFLACSSSKVGRGEGLLTSKQIPANIILISLQKKSNVSLLVSIMSTDLLTDTQRGVMKGLENKKCSSFERKEVTVVDWKHEGGKWETEAKMNWVMDKHGEWKHIPFWQLMKGGSKYVETQQTQTHHSAQLGLHFILIRLCRHHSFLQQFIYLSVRSSSVFLFQKELFPHNLTFEKGKSYRFKPQAEQCWGKSSDFNLVWGWCLQFAMNGVPLFFFYLCERKSSNFLHEEHQLSLSCWAVTYDRERSACSGSQNHSGFVPLSINQIIWCYAHLCAWKVRVKIPHSDPGAQKKENQTPTYHFQ